MPRYPTYQSSVVMSITRDTAVDTSLVEFSVFLPFNANTQLSLHSQTEGVQRLFVDHTLSISTSVHARNWPWGWVQLIVLPKVVAQ